MKRLTVFGMLLFLTTLSVPSYAFLDYLFSGGASRDAIDNSALGDLRAWWTGNPGYQFNPYWSGNQPPNQQQGQQTTPLNPASTQGYNPMGPPSAGIPQAEPPAVNYYPPQSSQGSYGQGSAPAQTTYGGMPQQQYQQVPQQYQLVPQQYQAPPQQYQQQVPQQYQSQASPQQYQQAPQQYQAPPRQYQPVQQQYPASSAYQGTPQAYQGTAQQPLPQAYPAGTQQ